MKIGGPLLLNSLSTLTIFQSDVCNLFIIAQTLIGFSTLGFVILLSILGLLPALYKMQLDAPRPEIQTIVKKMKYSSFRILYKFNETRSLNLLSFCSLALIVSGIFGFLYFLYQNITYLIVGCSISIGSISVMIFFIAYILVDLHQNAHYYKTNNMDKFSEFIDLK